MSSKKVGVFGIYSTRIAVENATDALVKAGFPVSDVSVLLPESLGVPKEMGTEKSSKAPEGTAAGVATGGVIGGTLGVLLGVGLLAIPGLGPFIAAGPIMAGLAGLGVGGAVGAQVRGQALEVRARGGERGDGEAGGELHGGRGGVAGRREQRRACDDRDHDLHPLRRQQLPAGLPPLRRSRARGPLRTWQPPRPPASCR